MAIMHGGVPSALGELTSEDAEVALLARQIAALPPVDPLCPICVALGALEWPEQGTLRLCREHLAVFRALQCKGWNADHAHQVAAGHASWDAFSSRWRASGGLPPLSADAARRYVTPEMVRGPLGTALPEALRRTIYRAWCAGVLIGVEAWLCDDPPPDPAGLWAVTNREG